MTEGHLEYFKIKNFKRFDELELTGLGQFNLITGDNNVGKTSLLEALLAGGMRVENQAFEGIFWALHRTLNIRGLEINPKVEYTETGEVSKIEFPKVNYLSFIQGDISKPTEFTLRYWSKLNLLRYWFKSFLREELAGKIANNELQKEILEKAPPTARYFTQSSGASNIIVWNWLHYEELKHGPTNKAEVADIAFIPVSQSSAEFLANNLTRLYSLVNPNLSRPIDLTLVEYLRTLIPHLEDLKVGGSPSTLYVRLNGKDEGTPINLFGDGVVRLTRLLFHLFVTQSPRLMIDEIDTGIHYSRLKDFLKCLVKLAAKKNVQLFMTTHSLECQQAFAEVFEDPEMLHIKGEFRNITLVEAQDHSVKPFIYNHEQLSQNLELGIETRGRKTGMKTLHFWVEGIADQKLLADLLRVWFGIDFHGNMKTNQTWEGNDATNNFSIFISSLGGVEGIKPEKVKNGFDQNTFQGIQNIALLDADGDFQARKVEIEAYKQEMTFDFFLLPDNQNPGDLETLLEEIINLNNQPIFDCWNAYENCLQAHPNYTLPARKTKIYAYLEALVGNSKSQKELIKEPNRNYTLPEHWDLDSQALQPLKQFLAVYFE